MKIVADPNYPGMYRWIKGKNDVARITLYPEGLVEFSSAVGDVTIENVGTRHEQVCVGNCTITY